MTNYEDKIGYIEWAGKREVFEDRLRRIFQDRHPNCCIQKFTFFPSQIEYSYYEPQDTGYLDSKKGYIDCWEFINYDENAPKA